MLERTEAERTLRAELKVKCLGLSSLERTIARQRARVRYLADGDANSMYFHLLARGRRRRNIITGLKHSDLVVTSHQEMEAAIYEHFVSVFGTAEHLRTELDFQFQALGVAGLDLHELDEPFSQEKIWAAIQELPADWAPGPDGFTGAFSKSSWAVIKGDVMSAINTFTFGDSRNFQRLNGALIVLLPKHGEACSPADYRPITMIHSLAKLISKAMALRLAPRMNELISKNQNAFIRGRAIHDNWTDSSTRQHLRMVGVMAQPMDRGRQEGR